MDRINADIVIAGAGVAGCHAAAALARAGKKVVVVERRNPQNLGHDWWDTVPAAAFTDTDVPLPEGPELLGEGSVSTIHPPLRSKTITMSTDPSNLSVDRRLFAKRQLKYATEAGAEFMFRTAALGPIVEDGRVCGLAARDRKRAAFELRAPITIDASGFTAALRSRLPNGNFALPKHIPREETFVTFREIRATDNPPSGMDVFFHDTGLKWICRKQPGLIDFLGGAINAPGRPSPERMVREMAAKEGVSNAPIARGGYGAPIPVRHSLDSFVADGLILCGDAACQTYPISGSGIGLAMRGAHAAAKTSLAALENGRFDAAALWPCNAEYQRNHAGRQAFLHAIQIMLIHDSVANIDALFARELAPLNTGHGDSHPHHNGAEIMKHLFNLLKFLDRPAFLLRVGLVVTTAIRIQSHYSNYPQKHSKREFDAWRREKDRLFASIGNLYR